jgi:hypothetical protein
VIEDLVEDDENQTYSFTVNYKKSFLLEKFLFAVYFVTLLYVLLRKG